MSPLAVVAPDETRVWEVHPAPPIKKSIPPIATIHESAISVQLPETHWFEFVLCHFDRIARVRVPIIVYQMALVYNFLQS